MDDYIFLTPAEVSRLQNAQAKGENQAVLDALRRNLEHSGDLRVTPELLRRVKHAANCWRDGGERAFLSVLEGAARHGL